MQDDEWLRTMYGHDDDDDDDGSVEDVPSVPDRPETGRYNTITQGFHKVQVPSRAYVEKLEATITEQERRIVVQERRLRRLEMMMRQQAIQHDRAVRDVRHDLDGKVDRNWS